MATNYVLVNEKYYNANLVGKVFTYTVIDESTQAEEVRYAMETLGGQRIDVSAQIYQDIIDGKYSGASITVDDELSDTSENPVQNKVITFAIETVREIACGKTASYVVDDTVDTIFDSQNDTITLVSSFDDINKGPVLLGSLRIGDVIYVTQTDVPDRWVQTITIVDEEVTSVTLGKMETAKVPVLDVQLDGTSIVNNGIANIQNINTTKMVTVADDGALAQTMSANVFYDFTGDLTSLDLTISDDIQNITNEFKGQISCYSTVPSVTFYNINGVDISSTIKWAGETNYAFPTLEVGKYYQFSILNNLGVIVGVEY